jgi:hypothetical protein
MARRSSEARKWLRDLDGELEVGRRVTDKPLQWSAHEEQTIGQICDQIDRKGELLALYAKAEDPDQAVKLSGEARLLEQSIARLMRGISTDVPVPRSRRSEKAAAAANARWEKDRRREQGLG